MKKWCVLLLCSVFHAKTSAQIAGIVFIKRSGSAYPQSGAEIMLCCSSGKVLHKTVSNAGGKFILSMPQAGDYKIQISLPGFKSHYDQLHVFKQISKIELAPILLEPTGMSVVHAPAHRKFRWVGVL